MKIRCAIIDDEPLALDLMESYVRKTAELQLVSRYSSAKSAIKGLEEEPVDLVFMDIQMPQMTGLELAQALDSDTKIIFTTAFSQYAVDAYRTNALGYLLKPISYADFKETVKKAVEWFNVKQQSELHHIPTEKEFMFVKSEYRTLKIYLKNILYIEGLKDYVKIYLEDQPKPILTLLSMKAMEEFLPQPQFCRVHRSYIVQMDKIEEVERSRIVFGKTYVPISDSNKEYIQDFINQHSIL